MKSALLVAIALLSRTPALAQGQVWSVSDRPCPDVDFTSLQAAVDSAQDGDTILVRTTSSDLGDVEVVQKSLFIVGDRDLRFGDDTSVLNLTVRDLLPGQSVLVKGMRVLEGLVVRDNAGEVWIEETDVSLPRATVTPSEIVLVEDCASVALVRCSWTQEGETLPIGLPWGGGQAGLRVVRSEVHLFDCVGEGARGVGGLIPPALDSNGLDGGPSVLVEEGVVNLSGCSLTGGVGGPGSDLGGTCGSGGAGGAALELADLASLARVLDSSLAGGSGGSALNLVPPEPIPCVDGPPGLPIDGAGASQVTAVAGNRRSSQFTGNGILPEGTAAQFVIEGQPGDLVFWGVGVAQDQAWLPGFSGSSLIAPIKVFGLGALPASGNRTLNLLIGDLTAPGQGIVVLTQTYHIDTLLRAFTGSAASAVVVDASYDPGDGCLVEVYVDDDAPGDPGPGDSSVSDPLEDGSPARPFDSIQEAVDTVILPGTRVLLADGVYQGAGNVDVNVPALLHCTIESVNGPDNCHVYAGGADNAFILDNITDVPADGLRGLRISGAEDRAVFVSRSSATIRDCIIEGNSAVNGGGIFVSNATMLVENCRIRSNLASVKGGGVYSVNSFVTLRNCQITNNASLSGGGGVSLGGLLGSKLIGCTLANNFGGGAEFRTTLTATGAIEILNSVIWGNTNASQVTFGFGDLEIAYSNVEGGLGGIVSTTTGTVIPGLGILDADPLFVSPTGFDYHLQPGSPCVDAGDPAFLPLPGETDIDGDPRLIGTAVDLGSDEL